MNRRIEDMKVNFRIPEYKMNAVLNVSQGNGLLELRYDDFKDYVVSVNIENLQDDFINTCIDKAEHYYNEIKNN